MELRMEQRMGKQAQLLKALIRTTQAHAREAAEREERAQERLRLRDERAEKRMERLIAALQPRHAPAVLPPSAFAGQAAGGAGGQRDGSAESGLHAHQSAGRGHGPPRMATHARAAAGRGAGGAGSGAGAGGAMGGQAMGASSEVVPRGSFLPTGAFGGSPLGSAHDVPLVSARAGAAAAMPGQGFGAAQLGGSVLDHQKRNDSFVRADQRAERWGVNQRRHVIAIPEAVRPPPTGAENWPPEYRQMWESLKADEARKSGKFDNCPQTGVGLYCQPGGLPMMETRGHMIKRFLGHNCTPAHAEYAVPRDMLREFQRGFRHAMLQYTHGFGLDEHGRPATTSTKAPEIGWIDTMQQLEEDAQDVTDWCGSVGADCEKRAAQAASQGDLVTANFLRGCGKQCELWNYYWQSHMTIVVRPAARRAALRATVAEKVKEYCHLFRYENMIRRVLTVFRVFIIEKHEELWTMAEDYIPERPPAKQAQMQDMYSKEWWRKIELVDATQYKIPRQRAQELHRNRKHRISLSEVEEMVRVERGSTVVQRRPAQPGAVLAPGPGGNPRRAAKNQKQKVTLEPGKKYNVDAAALTKVPCVACKRGDHPLKGCGFWQTQTEEGKAYVLAARRKRGGRSLRQQRQRQVENRTPRPNNN